MIGVRDYTEPYDYEVDGSWEPGEETVHKIESSEEEIEFKIRGDKERPCVDLYNTDLDDKWFWTVVHYCRDYGVPGVWKERLLTSEGNARLGGLYMIAGFDPNERERGYAEYGETPYVEGES